MLELVDLNKRYGDVIALDGASFAVDPGQLLGFLGPNGAGKTTTMRTIFGLVVADSGIVRWKGREIDPATRLRFGYMPEQRGLYPKMKIGEQLAYFAMLHGMTRNEAGSATTEWLTTLGLADRIESRLEELSHGNQQRVQLAAALVHDPELLVLDEPFSGLDPIGVDAMSEILAERAARGVAVVFSSHQLDLVEDVCEEVVIIDAGRIALEGEIRTLRSNSARRYLEITVSGAAPPWDDVLTDVDVWERRNGSVRVLLGDEDSVDVILDRIRSVADITQFSYEPPTLSEVFREAVGR